MLTYWSLDELKEPDGKGTMVLPFFSRRCVSAMIDLTKDGCVWALHGDGTYKINFEGWVLMTFGTHAPVWDERRKCYRHSFRPLLYMLTRSQESAASIRFGMVALQVMSLTYLAARLKPDVLVSDFGQGLRNRMQYIGWNHEFPELEIPVSEPMSSMRIPHSHDVDDDINPQT